ncbi:MAG: Cys-tRNA(Pro) deacylase, partial [Chloroflexota bacterium]
QAGGISPLALFNRGFHVVIDESALSHDKIIISGGQWGINIEMSPQDIISLTNAQSAKITN